MNESINQLTNQSISQSSNQSINQTTIVVTFSRPCTFEKNRAVFPIASVAEPLDEDTHPMTQLSVAMLALQKERMRKGL